MGWSQNGTKSLVTLKWLYQRLQKRHKQRDKIKIHEVTKSQQEDCTRAPSLEKGPAGSPGSAEPF